MIKTRGFGWALERVLGREDNRDSDEAPQRQRHTTSACRQRETILVAKDVHHMDDAVDEVFQQPQEDHPELKLSSHGRKVQKFGSLIEVTITLDDVASLLYLPIIGAFHSFETFHVDEVVLMLVELLEVSANEVRAKTIQCHRAYVRLSWLQDNS
ncbi:hypothetical protein GmHk_16G046873 [Glycine max]|nr:hypothetical protein GmHk_16G046873 [Glycine max]